MTAHPTLGSILVGSTRPQRLRDWYRATLAPGHAGDGPFDFGGVRLIIEGRDDVAATNPQPGRILLNFYVADARAFGEALARHGVDWVVPVEEREFGWIGTFRDPDGNFLQVAQLRSRR